MSALVYEVLGPLFGGAVVAVISFLTGRARTRAEVRKLDAEAEHIRAETTQLLLERRTQGPLKGDEVLPKGWQLTGSNTEDYEYGLDQTVFDRGHASAFIQSLPEAKGFTSLAQWIKAGAFAGRRVRLTGVLKVRGVEDWAGTWLRVDDAAGQTLAFDNTQAPNRRLAGTGSWQRVDIVYDVPADGDVLCFGVILSGRGRVWVDRMKLEIVGDDVPSTIGAESGELPDFPINLDFEEGTG